MQLMKSAENSMQPMLGYLAWESVKGTGNTAAKRLRMRQVEHFRSLFQSHFPVRSKSPARSILCAACGSVVLTVFSFMLLVFLTILWLLKLLLWVTRHRSLKQLVD